MCVYQPENVNMYESPLLLPYLLLAHSPNSVRASLFPPIYSHFFSTAFLRYAFLPSRSFRITILIPPAYSLLRDKSIHERDYTFSMLTNSNKNRGTLIISSSYRTIFVLFTQLRGLCSEDLNENIHDTRGRPISAVATFYYHQPPSDLSLGGKLETPSFSSLPLSRQRP